MGDFVAYKIYDSTNKRYEDYIKNGGNEDLITANIIPLSSNRDWISQPKDQISGPNQCFPLIFSNRFGYAISFPDDIVIAKDKNGIHVLSGHQYFYSRDPDTFGLDTNLSFVTKENISLMVMPAPNQFFHGLQVFTAFLSTSWWTGELQVVVRVTGDGTFKIPKNTPLASIVPIDTRAFDNVTLDLYTKPVGSGNTDKKLDYHRSSDYSEACYNRASSGDRSVSFYQMAINHLGEKIGEHPIKKFNFNINSIEEPYSRNNNHGTIFIGDE